MFLGASEQHFLVRRPNCRSDCVAAACRAENMLKGWSQLLTDIKASVQNNSWDTGVLSCYAGLVATLHKHHDVLCYQVCTIANVVQ